MNSEEIYRALEDVSEDFRKLSKSFTTTVLEESRISALCSALMRTAENLDQASRLSTTPEERTDLAKLYQGMLAAVRLVKHLYEQEQTAASVANYYSLAN